MNTTTNTMEVQAFIDAQPLSATQKLIIALCFVVVAIDGFDTAAVGFIAPALIEQWQLTQPQLAPLFGAGLFGLMIGALVFGPLADKIGRKPIMIGSVFVFGAASFLSAFSPDLQTLVILRFITGIGLGGAMPNAITMTSEFCPTARRSTLVTLMFCGFTIGSALGGIVSGQLIPSIGWQGILIIGGVMPLMILPILIWWFPMSLRFMVTKNFPKHKVDQVARRISADPNAIVPQLIAAPTDKAQVSVKELFSKNYALGTILMWIAFFMSMLIIYLISSWMPTLLKSVGFDLKNAAWITSVFQIGGTIGAITLGYLMDKKGAAKVLYLSYIAGAVFLIIVGQGIIGLNLALLLIGMFGIGVGVSGSQVGANAFSSAYYPTHCRATGVSWANAVGRSGSVVGSMVGGWLMAMNLSADTIVGLLAVPALVAAVMFFLIGQMIARQS
ncbi:aromatic acid/H+ symport family MFS transporter [uncultured Moraxella sp.]|uniref:MFS transporter n=1 Tax=uncultured Moraxella sp. TaxID=263769 RepID=UPI0025D52CA8|nr:aromatic acid/H+ symport family MFS transporter [uncultured Moraxella sp.]